MKRQSNVERKGSKFEGTTMASKKAKREVLLVEKGKEDILGKVVEERRDGGDHHHHPNHQMGMEVGENAMGWEENYWPWMGGSTVVDEQMSWGSIWLPSWDVEFMGEAWNALFSDVLCDDDIWGIRGIKEAPNP